MILLDTNVVSETMRPKPNNSVLAWLDRQVPETLFLTSITIAELKFGAEAVSKGKKRERLKQAVHSLVVNEFKDHILSFDYHAALLFGEFMAKARSNGLAVGLPDAMIASVALAQKDCSIATRDKAPFEAMTVTVINPWEA